MKAIVTIAALLFCLNVYAEDTQVEAISPETEEGVEMGEGEEALSEEDFTETEELSDEGAVDLTEEDLDASVNEEDTAE